MEPDILAFGQDLIAARPKLRQAAQSLAGDDAGRLVIRIMDDAWRARRTSIRPGQDLDAWLREHAAPVRLPSHARLRRTRLSDPSAGHLHRSSPRLEPGSDRPAPQAWSEKRRRFRSRLKAGMTTECWRTRRKTWRIGQNNPTPRR